MNDSLKIGVIRVLVFLCSMGRDGSGVTSTATGNLRRIRPKLSPKCVLTRKDVSSRSNTYVDDDRNRERAPA